MDNQWEARRYYMTDDCDVESNRLEMFMGGNGDWYLSIRFQQRSPRGISWRTESVRITTSGQRQEGMVEACAELYKAMVSRDEFFADVSGGSDGDGT